MPIPASLRILLLLPLISAISQAQATLAGSPITEDVVRARLESEIQTTNVVWGNLAVSAIADDNNNDSTIHPIGGTQYYFAPAIALQQTRPRWKWNLGYAPGLRLYLPTSQPAHLTQSFGGVLQWDISKRLAVGIRQDYLRTDDPFQQFGEAPLQSTIGILNRPPEVTFSTLRYSELLSQVELNYALEKHTRVGVNGSFMHLTWGQHQTRNQAVTNTRTSSGSAFLTQQFTARQSVGMQYQLLDMSFHADSRTITHGFFLFDRMVFSPRLTFTMFAGPQYSRISNQEATVSESTVVIVPESTALWSPAAGAMLSWQRNSTALYADFTKRVSAGLGLLSSVDMNEASLSLQRKVTSHWTANVSGQVNHETLLSATSGPHIVLWNIRAGISRELSADTHVHLAYQCIRQSGDYLITSFGLSTFGLGNHNRVLLTVERSFAWPMGR